MNAQWVARVLITPAGKSLVVERWQPLGMWHPVNGDRMDAGKGAWMPYKVVGSVTELAELVDLAELEDV